MISLFFSFILFFEIDILLLIKKKCRIDRTNDNEYILFDAENNHQRKTQGN
jgi:hypothetical protein